MSRPTSNRAAAVALIATPLFLLLACALSPAMVTDNHRQLELVAEHPMRQWVSALFALAALATIIPAALALRRRLRDRYPRAADWGAGTVIAGAISTAMSTGLGLLEWQMTLGGVNREQMVKLLDQVEGDPVMTVVFLTGALLSVGIVVLAIGVARAGVAPAWMPGGMAVGTIVVDLAFTINNLPTGIAGSAIMTAGMGGIGLRMLRGEPAEAGRPVTGVPRSATG
jgi:hypothetical protein